MPSGAAMTPNRMRRVSSDTRPPASRAALRSPASRSDFHDLGLFGLDQVVDLVDVVVVDLLQILLGVLDVVLGDALHLLQRLARMRARVPNGNLPFLGELVNYFHELLPALLVHGRQRHANDGALRRWIEPEIRLADRLLDGFRLRLVEWRNDQHPRLGRRDL